MIQIGEKCQVQTVHTSPRRQGFRLTNARFLDSSISLRLAHSFSFFLASIQEWILVAELSNVRGVANTNVICFAQKRELLTPAGHNLNLLFLEHRDRRQIPK